MFERVKSKVSLRVGVIALLVGGLGCSGGASRDPNWPETYPVTGTVVQDGQPVANVVVGFVPSSPDAKGARGKTDENGQYKLKTFFSASFDDEGAVAGSHKVTLFKPPAKVVTEEKEVAASTPEEAARQAMSQVGQQYSNRRKDEQTGQKSGLPERYMTAESTPLSFTVEPGVNTFDISVD